MDQHLLEKTIFETWANTVTLQAQINALTSVFFAAYRSIEGDELADGLQKEMDTYAYEPLSLILQHMPADSPGYSQLSTLIVERFPHLVAQEELKKMLDQLPKRQ